MFKINLFAAVLLLISGCNRAEIERMYAAQVDHIVDQIAQSIVPPPQGEIRSERYHAPKDAFSCKAEYFGEIGWGYEDYINSSGARVLFRSSGKFKLAEIYFLPGKESKILSEQNFKDIFEIFTEEMLKKVFLAQGIVILEEEMINEGVLFLAVAIDKMSYIRGERGEYLPSTQGYLIFKEKDKVVLLSNQIAIFPGERHFTEDHILKLKNGLLDFRGTFEFGPIPSFSDEEDLKEEK